MGHRPAYQRIYEDLAASISTGELAPTNRLLSEAQLAERYGVARMTIRQAIGQLVSDCMVVRVQGVGTFVAKNGGNARSLNRLTGFSEDMLANGQAAATVMLAQQVMDPSLETAAKLSLDKGTKVVVVERLRTVGRVPVIIQQSWIPFGLCPALVHEPLIDGSLYRTLETRFGVKLRRAEQRITAVAAGSRYAKLLKIQVRSPVLRLERLCVDDRNRPVELARSWTKPGFEFTVHLER